MRNPFKKELVELTNGDLLNLIMYGGEWERNGIMHTIPEKIIIEITDNRKAFWKQWKFVLTEEIPQVEKGKKYHIISKA